MDASNPTSPSEALQDRYAQSSRQASRLARQSWRLIRFKRIYLASILGYVIFDPTVSAILLPVAISVLPLAAVQHLLVSRWARARRSVRFFSQALDRLEGQWTEYGDRGERYASAEHPYASDLDLFGRGSLFQLLCRPCTALGRDCLAQWLLSPGGAEQIAARQQAGQELRDDLDFREQLDAIGAVGGPPESATLQQLAEAQPVLLGRWSRAVAAVGVWCWLVVCALLAVQGRPCVHVVIGGLAIEVLLYVLLRTRVLTVCSRGHQVGQSLLGAWRYARVLRSRRWQSPLLHQLLQVVQRDPQPLHPALSRSVGLLAQFPFLYLLVIQLVPRLETRLLRRLRHLPQFWSVIGQWEVLVAFASHAYEHPCDCYPEISAPTPLLHAERLGHPLILEHDCVRNDVRLDSGRQMLMVSGSNMSGKSTFLRTVGINAVLALAGATVRARSMRISPLVIGTAMRFQDSLEEGTSYFYSVLTRLRRVLLLLQEPVPLLFLLDEIMQGTNSHDRLVGAEAVIRKLLSAGAIGLVTTHDLELTRVAEHLAPAVTNVHFVDAVIEGQLHFDYRVRDGVVQSSNALQLMRDMGLDV